MAELISIAGGGDLGVELYLKNIYSGIDATNKEYDPEQFPGLTLRFADNGSTIVLYRTGKFNLLGASSIREMRDAAKVFQNEVESTTNFSLNAECEVRNLVFIDDYGTSIDFGPLIAYIGIENIEYEPEQFPAVNYRPSDSDYLFLIFSSGKIILTGVDATDSVEQKFRDVKELIKNSQAKL